MNAIASVKQISCNEANGRAIGKLSRSDAHGLSIAPCGRHSEAPLKISNDSTICRGRGGPRPGFGGRQPGAGRPRKAAETAPQDAWDGLRWCVYQTHPSAETTATHEITRAGYRAYMPLIAIRKPDAVVRSMFHKVRVPMFSGYGFVEMTATQPWVPIRYMVGVRDLLLTPMGRPGPVPVGFVEALMAGDERRCDLAPETMPPLQIGARVQLIEGPMTSFYGTVLGCDGLRSMVNVELFGRLVAVRMDRAAVVEAE